jgi:DNA uptake protein ComE-like DNA-binding protein
MNDGKKNSSLEEEYQFPQDEFIQGESTGRPSIESNDELALQAKSAHREKILKIYAHIRKILENRLVVIVLAVIVLLYFVHFFMTSKKTEPAIQAPAPVVQQPLQVDQPNPAFVNQLSGVVQSTTSMHDTITTLQSQLQTLQATVDQMSQTNQQYQSALIDVSKKVNDLQSVQAQLLSELAKKSVKSKNNMPAIAPVDFYTRAVVHNRAWVIGSNGENASISVGDHLRDYGKIVSIDANTGTITTDSGRVINYAPEDR